MFTRTRDYKIPPERSYAQVLPKGYSASQYISKSVAYFCVCRQPRGALAFTYRRIRAAHIGGEVCSRQKYTQSSGDFPGFLQLTPGSLVISINYVFD